MEEKKEVKVTDVIEEAELKENEVKIAWEEVIPKIIYPMMIAGLTCISISIFSRGRIL